MRFKALHIILLVVISGIIFGQLSQSEFVQYDDPAYVTENGIVNQGVTVKGVVWAFTMQGDTHLLQHKGVANLWHPLTWISHMVDCSFFGVESAAGHHIVNVVLHTLSAILILLLAQALGLNSWAALASALLFLIHPMKSESVAWVSERKDVLSGVFFILSLYLVLLKDGKYKGLAFIACLLALLSKPSAVVLPPVVVLLMLWKKGEDLLSPQAWIKESLKWVPWFAFSVVVAGVTVMMQAGGTHQAFMGSFPLSYRILTMGTGLLTYLYHLCIPHDLNFHYPHPRVPVYVHGISWLVVGVVVLGVLRFRERFPRLLPSLLWFLICWLPVSGILYVGTSFTCDRYVYLATILPTIFASHWLMRQKWGSYLVWASVILFSVLCFKQVSVWKNSKTLFEHATSAQPNDPLGWTNLGALYSIDKRTDEAIECYQKAIAINASEYFALHNLGDVYKKQERFDEALIQFEKVNEVAPSYLPSYRARGYILRDRKDLEAAIEAFEAGYEASNKTSSSDLWLVIETMLVAKQFKQAQRHLETLKKMPLSPFLQESIGKADHFLSQVN